MVFRGPTLVYCKQSLRLLYNINTTAREFSAVEYMLFDDWDKFNSSSLAEHSETTGRHGERKNYTHLPFRIQHG